MGGFQGALQSLSCPQLGGHVIQSSLARAGVDPAMVDEVIMGCVLSAGLGQAPARQALMLAGLPDSTPATTINKMCGSGMKAVMMAHDSLKVGSSTMAVAGGMESMSNAPYLLPKARGGMRMGHGSVLDHMFLDGLEDAYDKGRLMGTFAEDCASHFSLSRQQQDDFALSSLSRAQQAIAQGRFEWEVSPINVASRQGTQTVAVDEQPGLARPEKIPTLKPAFRNEGTVTAANSSSISDGAAALVLMRQSDALTQGVKPIARIVAHSSHAQAPAWFTTAPVKAIDKVLKTCGWSVGDVDAFEINEAFAVVALAAIKELSLDPQRVNLHGGACALGHPIGASGARIIVTLLGALKAMGGKRGVASVCIGGGEATAMAVELI